MIRVNLFEINLAVGILRDPSQGKIVWIILTIVKENKVDFGSVQTARVEHVFENDVITQIEFAPIFQI